MAQQRNDTKRPGYFSAILADRYQISPKAVRDIWTGRSWLGATYDLWNDNDRPSRRSVGRPKGKRDSKPRTSKKDSKVGLGRLFEVDGKHDFKNHVFENHPLSLTVIIEPYVKEEIQGAGLELKSGNEIEHDGFNQRSTGFLPILPSFAKIKIAALGSEDLMSFTTELPSLLLD